ncbi:hypothetical protein [Spongiimicrobium salis]|uniref:hypothetical protein n=1 Tax=Spongiimicrobium salis TaxID=1667022 RepID=UPI00374DEF3E
MKDFKGSKGPWDKYFDPKPYPFRGGQWRVKTKNSVRTPVAVLPESLGGRKDENGNSPIIKANAKLIATAPELLQSLQKLIQVIENPENRTTKPATLQKMASFLDAKSTVIKALSHE